MSLLSELEQLERELHTDIQLAQHRQEHMRLSARANTVARLIAQIRSNPESLPAGLVSPVPAA